jgi:subtilisin family serine protease
MIGAIKRMAPSASFVVYEANPVDGFLKAQAVAKALEHLNETHTDNHVKVLSISLGTQVPESLPDSVQESIESSLANLVNENVTIVIASGNDGLSQVS